MNFSIKLFFLLSLIASPAYAIDYESKKICSAGGFYSGSKDGFLSGMAMHILSKNDVLGTPGCSALWEKGYSLGESISRLGVYRNVDDKEIAMGAVDFSEKVYSFVAEGMGY